MEYESSGQVAQLVAALPEYVPAGHVGHVIVPYPFVYVPAGQAVHSDAQDCDEK